MAATTSDTPGRQADKGYKTLYENIAFFPELGNFRRYSGHWAKLIHDDTHEVEYYKYKVQQALIREDPSLC